MSSVRKLWLAVRSSLWFVPSVILTVAILLAVVMTEVDKRFDPDLASRLPRLFGAGADGSRALLGAIATSMMTITGVTFSITIVALALASTQFTPRILRNFMRNRTTQVVMGVFTGVFAYCLIVLRTIRGGEEEFVPNLSVLFGILLALVSVWVLILFIHHIASSIQASTVIAQAAGETMDAIRKLFPELLDGDEDDQREPGGDDRESSWYSIGASRDGYIQLIDVEALSELAREEDVIFRTERAAGDFVARGTPILSIRASDPPRGTICRGVDHAVGIGSFRTVEQDAMFGVRQLVDIAMKALSPSVNDSTTAVNCIDYIGAILREMAPRRMKSRERAGDEGRVILKGTSFEEAVAEAFDQIRESAEGNAAVLIRMLQSIEAIASCTGARSRRRVLESQIDLIDETAQRTIVSAYARGQVDERIRGARSGLAAG